MKTKPLSTLFKVGLGGLAALLLPAVAAAQTATTTVTDVSTPTLPNTGGGGNEILLFAIAIVAFVTGAAILIRNTREV